MKILSEKRCVIGEGPIWNQFNNKLYQVNGYGPNEIFCIDLETKENTVRKLPFGVAAIGFSKTALIKQLGPLVYVCFSFLFFKNERFSILKIIGAVIGFCGIIAINYSPDGIYFSSGDILIILASVCTVVSSVINKNIVKNNSPFWITGISQLSGGIFLFAAAIILGADMLVFNIKSALVFIYICTASIFAYVLYSVILRTSSLSKMFIIKFAEPLFACVFGAILLGENIFKLQYLVAFALISSGIVLGNKSEKRVS